MAGGHRDTGVSVLRCPRRAGGTSRVVGGGSGLLVLPSHRGRAGLSLLGGAVTAHTRGGARAPARPRPAPLSHAALAAPTAAVTSQDPGARTRAGVLGRDLPGAHAPGPVVDQSYW